MSWALAKQGDINKRRHCENQKYDGGDGSKYRLEDRKGRCIVRVVDQPETADAERDHRQQGEDQAAERKLHCRAATVVAGAYKEEDGKNHERNQTGDGNRPQAIVLQMPLREHQRKRPGQAGVTVL